MGSEMCIRDSAGAAFSGGLFGTSFREANLSGAAFKMVSGSGADFTGARLNGAKFDGCAWTEITFNDADLSNAVFSGCSILSATWERTNLSGASFPDTDLRGGDFSTAITDGVRFSGGSMWLTGVRNPGELMPSKDGRFVNPNPFGETRGPRPPRPGR